VPVRRRSRAAVTAQMARAATTASPGALIRRLPPLAGLSAFRFTAFGDEAAGATTAAPMVALAASLGPAFHLIAGDLAYATPAGLKIPDVAGFHPGQWDKYLGVIGANGAASLPWQSSVGAHEVETARRQRLRRFCDPFSSAV